MPNPIRQAAKCLSFLLIRFPNVHRTLRCGFLQLPRSWRGPSIVHDSLQDLAHLRGQKVFFIQIGANDGDANDPIQYFIDKYHWHGILVEPVPRYFEALRANHGSKPGLLFENLAISDSPEPREFWYLDDSVGHLPEWARGLGSFSKEEVVSTKVPGIDITPFLKHFTVPCLSLNGLTQKHGNPNFNVLVIDAQGYDSMILRQLDFSTTKPEVIVYEHERLSQDDTESCRRLLSAEGYQLKSDRWDTVATLIPQPS